MKPIRVALIPAYQPDELLLALLRELSLREFFIVVVNDGSGRESDPLFAEASRSAVILNHPEHCGRGAALRTGLEYLKAHFPFRYTVVTLDAGCQYRISDAEHVCRTAEEHPDALVLGVRDGKGKIPLRSRIGNRMRSLAFKLTTGVSCRDPRTMLRAFSSDLTEFALSVSGDSFRYESRMLSRCARRRIPIAQVSVKTIGQHRTKTA